jgi:signal transduction histidine kinase/ligand-binding sensor domain-containing protein
LLAGLGLRLVPALPVSAAGTAWLSRAWQSDDGLPDNTVTGVAQSSDGYLWVATAGGLMRFDGVRFQEVPVVDLGIPNRVVRVMWLDRKGKLWLGMDRGPVVCIEPGAAQVFKEGLPDARASSMADDAEGSLWIACGNGSVSQIKNGRVEPINIAEPGSVTGAWLLAGDTPGRLWFGKDRQVGIRQDEKWLTLLNLPAPVARLGLRRAGGIWICSGAKLWSYDAGGEPEEFASLPEIAGDEVTALLEDRSGAVWIGTAASGLFRCEKAKHERVPTSHPEITCLMEDREGNIWAGTAGGGLNRLRPSTVELLGAESGLPFESVRSVCEDAAGAIWITTQNGLLARWQEGVWTTVSQQPGWPGGHPNCVAADSAEGIWIGTHDSGLVRRQNGQWSAWRQEDGLAAISVRSLLVTTADEVWVATDSPNQLQRLRGKDWQNFDFPTPTRSLRAMAQDRSGDVWVASADGQLFRVHGDQVVSETARTAAQLQSIRCLLAAPDGSLWIGYAGWGLGRLKDGRYSRITAEQGLNDNYISQMAADGRGWLWCAGNRGLFQVSLEELAQAADHTNRTVRCILHGRGDGLANLQANYDYFPGALLGRDGRIWFPMRTGLAVVHSENLGHNSMAPPVLLERVQADGQNVALYDSPSPLRQKSAAGLPDLRRAAAPLQLGPGHRKLEFDFTALSFTAPENVHFKYRLENFDEGWIEADAARMGRSASYPRLPPGKYRFQVKACNNDGVWNDTGAAISLVVTPFFWQGGWFQGAVFSGFTLSVIAVVRYVSFRRLRLQLRLLEQQSALHQERARIAKDIHDDLGASLTQIAFLGELAGQDHATPDKAAERTETISATARQAIKSLDEIVWAVNPRNDTLAHLLDYSGQFALDYLRVAGIRCRLDFPEQAPSREVSADQRHNLFLASKEALHNIVKHSQAGEVWIRVVASEIMLRITIEDNGVGFAHVAENALADGLRNMRQRLDELGGTCHIESQPGAGTLVTFEVIWPARG